MVPATSHELVDSLRRTDLLSASRAVRVAAELLPSLSEDPQELAFALVQRGWLTSYQAESILRGNADQLTVGGYQLLEPLGVGGMGEVFKAWQKKLSRIVALKMIRRELIQNNPGAVRRFQREALAVARLSHPNIVSIYDADEANGIHFIVLEFVDGPDLERLVVEHGPLPPVVAADFVRQAALGLQHAHEHRLVHRDIKPSNLLIARPESGRRVADHAGSGGTYARGLVKILDMGLARMGSMLESPSSLTREGAMMGTPDYIAPEQARDASSVDIRADLYSLGCTLYFLLAGHPPFPDGTMIEKLMKHQQSAPEPLRERRPDVPDAIVAIVTRLMAKSPDQRFQLPIEVAEALTDALEDAAHAVPIAPAVAGTNVATVPAEVRLFLSASTPPPAVWPTRAETRVAAPAGAVMVVTAASLQPEDLGDDSVSYDKVRTTRKISVLRGHKGAVTGVAISPDCRLLATGGVDSTIHLWQISNPPKNVAVLKEHALGDVQVLGFAPRGDFLVSGSGSTSACLVNWIWQDTSEKGRTPIDGPRLAEALAFSPDGASLASGFGSSISMWSVHGNDLRKRAGLEAVAGDVKCLAFSDDGRMLAAGTSGGAVQTWKLGWLGARQGQVFAGHRGAVTSLTVARGGDLLASAGIDRSVRVWPLAGGQKAVLQGLKGVVRQMMFLPDPELILTACDGGQVILWNWADGTRQHEWKLDQPIICSLALASDGCLLAAGSSDGTASIYDLAPEGP